MNISINRLWTIIGGALLLVTLVLSYDMRLALPVQLFKSGLGGLSVLILCLMLFRISEATSVYRLKQQYHLLADETDTMPQPIAHVAQVPDAHRIPPTDQNLLDSAVTLPRRKAKDLKDAIRLQRGLVDSLKSGQNVQAENPTVAEYVERWISGRRLAPRTIKRYRQSLRWQIVPMRIGRLRIRQITHTHVSDWVKELEVTPTRGSLKGSMLDPYSIRNAFAVLRGALNGAVRGGLIPVNPCRNIELPLPDDEQIQPMTLEQIGSLFRVVDCYTTTRAHRQAALYHVAIRCGLRFGELIGLRWQDVNLDLQELRVVGQLQDQKRKRAKTRRSHRTVPLSPNLVGVLRAHWLNQQSERSVSPATWNAAQLVFCSETGTPIGESNLRRQFVGFQRRAGLSAPCPKCQATGLNGGRKCGTCQGQKCVGIFRVHDMRHMYAAIAIAADVDIFTLSQRMGHESITTTANTYGHFYKGKTDDADAIDQLLQREGD